MSFFAELALLAPLLPLAGALLNRPAAVAGAVIGLTAVIGAIAAATGQVATVLLLAQLPFLAVATGLSVAASGGGAAPDDGSDVRTRCAAVEERHGALKAAVSRAEERERLGLQIYGLAKGLAEALSWKDLAPRLTTGIQRIFDVYEFLLVARESDGALRVLFRRGGWAKAPPVSDLPQAAGFLRPPEIEEVVPVLAIPIFSGASGERRVSGAMFLKAPGGGRTEEEWVGIGREFGEQLAPTLEKAFLFSEMERQSRVDGLTGVLRRSAFMDRLAEEFKRAAVFHTPFSLLMIDIDHFKAVNDNHGHPAGDAVLTRVGEMLRTFFYETDVVGRYGGEEFVVLLPKAQADGVRRKADALRARIEQEEVPAGFEKLRVTLSIGIAHFPGGGTRPEDLIGAADRALYAAKAAGRNRVEE